MRKLSVITTTIFLFTLFVTTGAMANMAKTSMNTGYGTNFEQLRTPMQQSPEAQTPGVIELGPAGSLASGTPHEFYAIAPRYEEGLVQRTPMQQSPEAQTPGIIELTPAGFNASGTPHEFYGIAPRYEEDAVERTPVQQSPEMQTPGVIELAPSGSASR